MIMMMMIMMMRRILQDDAGAVAAAARAGTGLHTWTPLSPQTPTTTALPAAECEFLSATMTPPSPLAPALEMTR
jgi:hypothetical protein